MSAGTIRLRELDAETSEGEKAALAGGTKPYAAGFTTPGSLSEGLLPTTPKLLAYPSDAKNPQLDRLPKVLPNSGKLSKQ